MNKLWMTLSVILAIVIGVGAYFGKEAYGNYRRIKDAAAMCPPDRSAEIAKLRAELQKVRRTQKQAKRQAAEELKTAVADAEYRGLTKAAYEASENRQKLTGENEKLTRDLATERASRTQRIAERTAYLQERMDAYRIALGTVLDGAFREAGFRGRYQQFPRTAYPWPTIRYGDLRLCIDSGVRRGMENGEVVWRRYRVPIEFDQGAVKEVGLPTRDDSASLRCPDISFGFFTFDR